MTKEITIKCLSVSGRKAKFLKGIPFYDPSTLEHGWLFPSNDDPESDPVDDWENPDGELGDWANPDGELPYDRIEKELFYGKKKEYAKQITLAFALSQHNAKRAKEAEEFIKLIEKEEPSAYLKVWYEINVSRLGARLLRQKSKGKSKKNLPLTKVNKEKLKKFLQKTKWRDWDRDFNWYAPHTTAEISMAVKVSKQTILRHFPKPKARITKGKASAFLYSKDDMILGMEWWLWDYLAGKCKDRITMWGFGQEILKTEWFKHLSKTGEEKISRVLVDPIRPEPRSTHGFFPFGRPPSRLL